MNDSVHPSDLVLDLHLQKATSPADESHIEDCARCKARLEDMQSKDRAFLARYPNPSALISSKGSRRPFLTFPTLLKLSMVPALALMGFLIIKVPGNPKNEGLRAKGLSTNLSTKSSAKIFVRRADAKAFEFSDQSLLPGDTLVFRYSTTMKFGLLLSVEDSGATHVYFSDGHQSATIIPGKDRLLEAGVRLDDYEGPERFVLLFSREPISVQSAKEALKRHQASAGVRAPLPALQANADQVSWVIKRKAR